jgi:hypothetical protein
MNTQQLHEAAAEIGHLEPVSIEPDGSMWTGTIDNKKDLTEDEIKAITKKANDKETAKATAKAALLDKLGITADEAALLLG